MLFNYPEGNAFAGASARANAEQIGGNAASREIILSTIVCPYNPNYGVRPAVQIMRLVDDGLTLKAALAIIDNPNTDEQLRQESREVIRGYLKRENRVSIPEQG